MSEGKKEEQDDVMIIDTPAVRPEAKKRKREDEDSESRNSKKTKAKQTQTDSNVIELD